MDGDFLTVAREAACAGGQVLRRLFGTNLEVVKKGAIDLLTRADLESEQAVRSRLESAFPDHGFLLEEGGCVRREAEWLWVVDPLDGTTNFAHGYPVFCVSIGLLRRGEPVLGVVCDPLRDELFWAQRGAGAWMNGRRLAVSTRETLPEALLVTGFPYDIHTNPGDVIELLGRFLLQAQAVRRDGSAALDLCYVAAGRVEGFWERRLKPWDTAAGAIIVTEAGGRVTRFDGTPYSIFDPDILASNGLLHGPMRDVIAGG